MTPAQQRPEGFTGKGSGEPHPFAKGRASEEEARAAMALAAAQTRRDHAIADAMEELANLARGASILLASRLPEGTDPADTQDFRREAESPPA